jgi:hypothetical protein
MLLITGPCLCRAQGKKRGTPDGALLQLLQRTGDGLHDGILVQQDDLVLGGVHIHVHLIARDGDVLQGTNPA